MGRTIPAPRPTQADHAAASPSGAADPIPPLDIRLLGRVELAVDGREIRLASRGAQALMALLALKPRIRSREAVATEIWPDGEGSGTSASLRQALWLVRSSFASAAVALDRYVTIDAEVIGLSTCAPVVLDVARFEGALRGPMAEPEEAVALYHGDLVECLGLECFAIEAERLSDAYEDALVLVAERRLAAGDLAGARDAAERLLARDPLREEAHITLLQIYGQSGSRAQVARQYRRLGQLLADELGVEPLPETVAAYRLAMHETVERSQARATALAFSRGLGGTGRRARTGGLVATATHR